MRGLATSTDGGVTWTEIRHEKQLPCPKCQGSMTRLAATDSNKPGLLLASNPFPTPGADGKPGSSRIRLTLRTSADEGRTWTAGRELYGQKAAYSCLAQLADGTVLCIYEGGEKSAYAALRLARFSPAWLDK